MKRILLLSLLLFALLCGCGEKDEIVPETAPQAVSAGENAPVHKAEDSADADWAKRLSPAPAPAAALRRTTKFSADGSVLSWVDYTSDSDGRTVKSVPRSATGDDPDAVITVYEYVNGYLTAATEYNSVTGDRRYRYKYDADGREVKWILYGEDGEVSMWYEDSFDGYGNVTSHVLYRPGQEPKVMNLREYDYDERGNPIECRYLNEKGTVLSRYSFRNVYDEAGRLVECEQDDVGGSVLVDWYRYTYDADGRLIETRQLDAGERCLIRTELIYDAAGNLVRQQFYSSDGALAVVEENLWE